MSRTAVGDHGGLVIKTTGGGVLALFTGPAQGMRCARRMVADAHERGLDLPSGVHTGEVERSTDDVAGLAVHLAARIMSLADAGEVLVSRIVRDFVIGSELTFSDRGEQELKGIPMAGRCTPSPRALLLLGARGHLPTNMPRMLSRADKKSFANGLAPVAFHPPRRATRAATAAKSGSL